MHGVARSLPSSDDPNTSTPPYQTFAKLSPPSRHVRLVFLDPALFESYLKKQISTVEWLDPRKMKYDVSAHSAEPIFRRTISLASRRFRQPQLWLWCVIMQLYTIWCQAVSSCCSKTGTLKQSLDAGNLGRMAAGFETVDTR